jgi:hypothetical protein
MLTRLERGSADTWAEAGRSIAGGIGALIQGEAVKQRAQQEQEDLMARIYAKNMQGNQYGANAEKLRREAELAAHRLGLQQNPLPTAMLELGLPTAKADDFRTRLETGQWGGQYAPPGDGMGPTIQPPADDDTVARLGRDLALLQRMYGTGSNVDQAATASLKGQQQRLIDQVASNPAQGPAVGQAYAATSGKPLFGAVGNTGVSLNQFTGQQGTASPELMDLFTRVQRSIWNENNAQAGSASASAANSRASADLTAAKLKHFLETGRFPGTEGSGEDATNAKTRNAIIASVERELGATATESEISAEVERRLARRNFTAPPQAGAQPIAQPIAQPMTQPSVQPGAPALPSSWEPQQPAVPAVPDAATEAALAKARNAIRNGADPAAVRQRLAQGGIDPARLNQPAAPAAAAAGPVVDAPRNPTDRVKNAVYRTPKGNMKWTGTGWIPAQ